MTEPEAAQALHRLGFAIVSLYPTSSAMDICRGKTAVGTIRFDENRRINKLELSPFYFSAGRIVLREFADEVFQHFNVRTAAVDDDVCYWDVTCFRGTTLAEQFLILRLAGDVQLHVSRRRLGSDAIRR